jgi:hypothetical protein
MGRCWEPDGGDNSASDDDDDDDDDDDECMTVSSESDVELIPLVTRTHTQARCR